MLNKYRDWLQNTPVQKKFLPTQILIVLFVVMISLGAIWSVVTINQMSHKVFTENVENTEQLNEIIRTMYRCRVGGRDILLQEDEEMVQVLYDQYIEDFNTLDTLMDEYLDRLNGEDQEVFSFIITEKNKYKDSMILSADIKMDGGDYDLALEALQIVTPIATAFFDSVDNYLAQEKQIMEEVLIENEVAVNMSLIMSVIVLIVVIILLLLSMRIFTKSMSRNLEELESSVSEIATTGNMSVKIPDHLFTKDEVGSIARVVDELKTMLLEYSFKDSLTGGYNAKAYHHELVELFENDDRKKFWCAIFDMNNLKMINDKFGHIDGDLVIKKAYSILMSSFGKYGKIYRVGGDEFVAILKDCTEVDIEAAVTNMNNKIERENRGAEYYFSLAWGYEEFTGKSRDEFNKHFNDVDKKMYKNKNELKRQRYQSRVSSTI